MSLLMSLPRFTRPAAGVPSGAGHLFSGVMIMAGVRGLPRREVRLWPGGCSDIPNAPFVARCRAVDFRARRPVHLQNVRSRLGQAAQEQGSHHPGRCPSATLGQVKAQPSRRSLPGGESFGTWASYGLAFSSFARGLLNTGISAAGTAAQAKTILSISGGYAGIRVFLENTQVSIPLREDQHPGPLRAHSRRPESSVLFQPRGRTCLCALRLVSYHH